ncbi:hypothetical protein FHW00_003849 [Ochrobactrum sp. P6BSIII]|nr:hypothetical protein [Ochrobactrum sp. P6BSIII]
MKKYLVYTTLALATMAASAGQSYANPVHDVQSQLSANGPADGFICIVTPVFKWCPFK